jgi:hypothetical protein
MHTEPLPPIGVLLSRTAAFYRRYLRLILLVTFPIVAFVDVVIGAGLGELTASAHKELPLRDFYISGAAELLVTVPLVLASLARAVVIDQAGGEPPRAWRVLQEGFDLFLPVLLVVLVVTVGVTAGSSILVLPGIYVFVSWYFAVQAVAVDGRRGFAAIRMSAEVVRGNWWRSLGVGMFYFVVLLFVSVVPRDVFASLAVAADSYAVEVVGTAVVDTLALPFLAIGSTLYYLELRSRSGAAAL